MKLSLRINDIKTARIIRQVLGFILTVRKDCILKFTQNEMNIISFDVNNSSPLFWSSIGQINFDRYDVIAKDDTIVLDINIETLFHIMKNYEKAASVAGEMNIKLQRGQELQDKTSKTRPIYMVISYIEEITETQEISHLFSIPVSLSRANRGNRLNQPEIVNFSLILDLNCTLISFFQRVERYKAVDNINIVANKYGELKIEFENNVRKTSIKWKGRLDTYTRSDMKKVQKVPLTDSISSINNNSNNNNGSNKEYDGNTSSESDDNEDNEELEMFNEITVNVKSKWWNLSSKIIEVCDTLQMIIWDQGCVFSCNINDEPSCTLLYVVPGKILE
ncbi:hypothetical protein C6P40_003017 [Pichia californica]|uniref:Checkpoint protein n=1 Tax=Pichia californica TaxID=460514 RepID=A0A9P6WH41_9ASCO|nr:hypothetical protein C6P42_002500 [[Candida] californica]KAG0687021.1 hypothetical protein C6P40_003017 [[Candida] californica]